MSRGLHYANCIGVLALSILCVVQWQRDRKLNLEINRLEMVRISKEETIREQEKTMVGLKNDLAFFKDQTATAHSELRDIREGSRRLESDNERLTLERDQLRDSVRQWSAAVNLRDERLKEANERIQNLADQLNASILKFNELATNYNSVVVDLNQLREKKAP